MTDLNNEPKLPGVEDWLRRKMTVSEAEAESMTDITRPEIKGIPFGFMNDIWNAFKALIVEGDELWYFKSDEDSWRCFCGRAGYAIVRNGEVKYVMKTEFN
jgi:hypothetical protein